MNAGPADTRFAHLDLAELVAEVTGQAIDDWPRRHLAGCERCRLEAKRWSLVAEGVRTLAAVPQEAAQTTPSPTAPPLTARPRSAAPRTVRPRGLAGPRRRAILAGGAAAALVLLGGAGYWAVAANTRHAPEAVLTAVSGCTGYELAHGTLAQMNGGRLVIRSASGQRVTVITTASTEVSVAGALLGDVTDGAPVIVLGPRSGGAIAAVSVVVGPPPAGTGGKGALRVTPPPGWVVVRGTVSGANAAGFTVVTPGGTLVQVATTSGTRVLAPHASLAQLRVGATTVALGRPGPDRTLMALGVLQQPPQSQIRAQFNVRTHGCSPASVANALAAALGSGG